MFRVCKAALPGMLAQRARLDRQHGFGRLEHKRGAESVRLWRHQGRGHRPDPLHRRDFVGQGVRCQRDCAGTVASPSLRARMAALPGDPEAVLKSFIDRQPMGGWARPDEVATLAVYLASDESGFTTGAVHVIDGGWTA